VRRPSPVRSIVGPPARSTRQHRPAITTGSGDHRGPIQNPPGAREGLETDLTFVGDQHQERRTGVCTRVATNRCQGLLPDHRLVATVCNRCSGTHQGSSVPSPARRPGRRETGTGRKAGSPTAPHAREGRVLRTEPSRHAAVGGGLSGPTASPARPCESGPSGPHLPAQRARVLLSKQVHHVVVAPYPNDGAPAPGAPRVLDRELDQP